MATAQPGRVKIRHDFSPISQDDLYLFNEGSHLRMYEKLGAHPMTASDGAAGVFFAVWAPNAHAVFVMGDFNDYDRWDLPLKKRGDSGVWEGFVAGARVGQSYKFHIESEVRAYKVDKADPYANWFETPPNSASRVADLSYDWGDAAWLERRAASNTLEGPMSIYEVHLGSWRRSPDDPEEFLSYRDLAGPLAEYCLEMGFTHVEFLPVMEHPFYPSWGYQDLGFFAPTSRYGLPTDFMFLVDALHQAGLGVILDWVPSHFPTDDHGLNFFDGTHLYEHADPKKGYHPDWNSSIFNYGRDEVRSFLFSSAFFWLEVMHADGLRVDAVASMLYLNYSREDGEWIPNKYGGNENLEAVDFLRRLNSEIYQAFPGVQTIAEESTAWPMVSRPTYLGGLGFGMKWDMGWMHDTLSFMRMEPVYRKYHHNQLTFRMLYAFTENFVLALSHDEVVHGKGSLIGKMPGDEWQRFANLRLMFSYMFGQPGKKLLFMGGEFGQYREWRFEESLDWHLLQYPVHAGVKRLVADLNRLYAAEPALHDREFDGRSFEWVDCSDALSSVLAFLRHPKDAGPDVLVVLNFTPVVRRGYRIGVNAPGFWTEELNSDAGIYGGGDVGNNGGLTADEAPLHGRPYSLDLTLPPLGALFLKAPA